MEELTVDVLGSSTVVELAAAAMEANPVLRDEKVVVGMAVELSRFMMLKGWGGAEMTAAYVGMMLGGVEPK